MQRFFSNGEVILRNGFSLPQLALGTYPLKGDELINSLEWACSAGYGLVDTAIGYDNEDIVGEYISSRDVLISTKYDAKSFQKNFLIDPLKRFAGHKIMNIFITNQIIEKTIEKSLSRLRRADIMLLHAPFSGCVKVYNILRKYYETGIVKAYGVSNFNIEELQQLYNMTGEWPMINQTEISPVNTQKELISFCQERGIVVEAYSPFGRGNLVHDFMNNEMLNRIADSHGKSVGQVILRWAVQQGIVVVVRSSNPQRIKENSMIFDFELTENEMKQIDQLNKNSFFGINQIGKQTVRL